MRIRIKKTDIKNEIVSLVPNTEPTLLPSLLEIFMPPKFGFVAYGKKFTLTQVNY
jgi:hypothetical protein